MDWTRSFGKHDLGALVGYEAIRNWGFNTDMAKQGAADASLTDLSTYTELSNITGTTWENTSRSFFGRLTYAYKSRYLFEVNAVMMVPLVSHRKAVGDSFRLFLGGGVFLKNRLCRVRLLII